MKLQRRQFRVSFENKLEDDNKLGNTLKITVSQWNHYLEDRLEYNSRLNFGKKVLSNVNQFSNKNIKIISLRIN